MKFLKTKIQLQWFCIEATGFHKKEIPKVGSNCIFLVIILLDVVLKKYENYYLQVLLKESKYFEKEKKVD